jgi:NAD(P)-dependent dehydrogenase (short-subunit alcohol dehydrogenase family)
VSGRHEGRVAIVTGGGHNIGRAVAVRLAAEGARVVVAGRRAEPLAEAADAIRAAGGAALAVPTDVTDRAAVEALVAAAAEAFGPVDALAAIAGGGGGYEPVDTIDPDWWEHVLRINVVGTFQAVRAVLPGMRERGRGALVTCTGGGAFFPVTESPATAYATAKAAICRFTDQLAVELWDTGVRVNCLQPGQTWSPERQAEVAAEEARTGEPHPGRATNHPPEDAAELASWLASDASAPLTGRAVSVDDDWWRDPARVQAVHASHHAYTLRRVEGG